MLGALRHRTAPQESRLQSRAGALSISGLMVSWSLPHDGQDGGPGQHPHDQPFPDSLSQIVALQARIRKKESLVLPCRRRWPTARPKNLILCVPTPTVLVTSR